MNASQRLAKLEADQRTKQNVRVSDALADAAEQSLAQYVRMMWPTIEPGTEILWNWHIDAIAEALGAVDAGQVLRLLITMPPRSMKSIMASVGWPTWRWIKRPESRWMFSSYSQSLSTSHSVDRRTIIESEWYRERWGDRFKLTSDQNVKTEYRNDHQGRMIATSMDGTSTGKGVGAGGALVVDDAHDPKQAESDTQREATIMAFDRKLTTRLDNKKTGAIVIVGQRVNERDIAGHVLKQGGYTHLNLPAECEQRTIVSLSGGRTITREVGDLLWPEREGPAEIAQAKVQLGPYGYSSQYQQRPSPAGGARFKQEWFRYFEERNGIYALSGRDGNTLKSFRVDECDRFAMCDPAGAEKRSDNRPCYSVIQLIDITPDADMLVVDQYRAQVSSPVLVDQACAFVRKHDAPWIGVEQDGIGLGSISTLRRKGVTVRAIKCRGSKEARSETAEIRMSAGMVFFRKGAPWLFDFESELLSFPQSEFKDQVDTLSHAAIWVQKIRGAAKVQADHEHEAETTERTEQAEQQAATTKAKEKDEVNPLSEDERWRRFIRETDEQFDNDDSTYKVW